MQTAHWSTDRATVPRSRCRNPSSVAKMIVRIDRPVATRSGRFARMDPPKSDSSSSAVSREENRRKNEKVVIPIVRAITSPYEPLAQASTPRVPAAITRPLNTSQVIRRRGMICCSLGRGGTAIRPSRGLP